MTSTFMRPALALTLALSLAACGGKAGFQIGGTVSGLAYSGLVLTSNGMDLPVKANATSFSFPNSISYGEVYNVTAKAQPLHQTCQVASGSDTAGRLAVINVGVLCALNTFAIGGSITGLTSAGLTLTNGSTGGTAAPAATDTTFSFSSVPYGVSYGVTVLAQPANENCSVTQNAAGVMGDAAVNNIVVTCVPKQ